MDTSWTFFFYALDWLLEKNRPPEHRAAMVENAELAEFRDQIMFAKRRRRQLEWMRERMSDA